MKFDVAGHSLPSGGFEVPLEMLHACHSRIHSQCSTLLRLVPHLARHGADDDARKAAAGVMRYFDTAARDHHADEEADLFPALIESMAGSDAVCLRDLTSSLAAEHRVLETHWLHVRALLKGVVAGESVSIHSADVQPLVNLYKRHIEREEEELLPMAARLLSDDQIEHVGRAMRLRRGVPDLE